MFLSVTRRRLGVLLSSCTLAACGVEPAAPAPSLHAGGSAKAPLSIPGCGDGGVQGSEECDGAADAACPGRCSAQCACPAGPPRPNLEVHVLDVGQGDGILILSPAGFAALLDAGTESNAAAIEAYVNGLGLSDVDYSIVSHMHADHMGAMDMLLGQFTGVTWAFDSGSTGTSGEYLEYDAAAGSRRVTLLPADVIDMGPGVTVEVVHGDIASGNENDNSLVLRITHGSTTVLLGGDCESPCENDFNPGPIDVYKVHHHGSSNATSDGLLAQMQPTTALISVGAGNPYGHPTQSTLDKLAAAGVVVHRTDLEGTLVVSSDGAVHTVNAPLSCSNGQTRSCGTSEVGACALGVETCSGGTWGACVGEVGPVPETCANGLDDDCDGLTDGADPECLSGPDHLLITQVAYDTPGTDAVEEFVDLYNPTGTAVLLDGWALQDNSITWSFPAGIALASGAYLSVARDFAGFTALYGQDPDVVGLSLALGNSGDRVTLLDPASAAVDEVAWEGFVAGWPIAASIPDSIERLTLTADTDTVGDWGITSPATPRGGPQGCSGDGECDNGAFCDGVETCDPVLGCQSGGDPCPGALCDEGTDGCVECLSDADCGGATPRCDLEVGACVECLAAADCNDGLFCNGAEGCSAGACVAGGAPDCSGLATACAVGICDEAGDACVASPLPDATPCDDGDGCGGDQCLAGACEPAPCQSTPVLIAQVAYDTPGNDAVEEHIELFNRSGVSVSLTGWSLADDGGAWSFPAGTSIAPGAYLTVARNRRGFKKLYGFDPDLWDMSLSLANDGDLVQLRDPTPAVVDAVAWENYLPGWSINAPIGAAIDRIDPGTDTDSVADWQVTSPASPH